MRFVPVFSWKQLSNSFNRAITSTVFSDELVPPGRQRQMLTAHA
jgi:hypothetical protein